VAAENYPLFYSLIFGAVMWALGLVAILTVTAMIVALTGFARPARRLALWRVCAFMSIGAGILVVLLILTFAISLPYLTWP
jgi:hypothetical protein